MRVSAIALLAAVATLGFAGAASADDNGIDITARNLPKFAPVAVTGTVAGIDRNTLIIHREDGMVRADLGKDPVMLPSGKLISVNSKLIPGEEVTVFGRLQKTSSVTKMDAKGVLVPSESAFYVLDSGSKLASVQKFNSQPNPRTTLRRYLASYQPL